MATVNSESARGYALGFTSAILRNYLSLKKRCKEGTELASQN